MTPKFEDLSFEQLAEFLRDWAGIRRKTEISPETLFEDDLGITGDDGRDLLVAAERHFGTSLVSRERGFRQTFGLEPNQTLFHSEGLPFGGGRSFVVAFTVGQLYRAVLEALKSPRD